MLWRDYVCDPSHLRKLKRPFCHRAGVFPRGCQWYPASMKFQIWHQRQAINLASIALQRAQKWSRTLISTLSLIRKRQSPRKRSQNYPNFAITLDRQDMDDTPQCFGLGLPSLVLINMIFGILVTSVVRSYQAMIVTWVTEPTREQPHARLKSTKLAPLKPIIDYRPIKWPRWSTGSSGF